VGWSRVGDAPLEGGQSELRRKDCSAQSCASSGVWGMARMRRAMDRA
jgi:hypothetical protein